MRSLHAEGLIETVPRRYSIVTRMSPEDAEDVCYARYVLEDASVCQGLERNAATLAGELHEAVQEMAAAAAVGDLDALVEGDTRFHERLIDVSGRPRLKDLWSMLNSQMGALMRSEIERQGIGLAEAAGRHRLLVEAVGSGDVIKVRDALREHYMMAFPARGGQD